MLSRVKFSTRTRLIIFAIIFFVFLPFYVKHHYVLAKDLSDYLCIATSLRAGHGWVYLNGNHAYLRPGFVYFLSIILNFIGGRIVIVSIILSVFAVFLVMMMYEVISRLYDDRAGIIAVILWFFTPGLFYMLPVSYDSVWPVFFLLAWRLLLGEIVNSKLRGFFVGLFFSLIYLFKPPLFILLLFPFLFYLFQRKRISGKLVLSCYVTIVAVVVLFSLFTRHFIVLYMHHGLKIRGLEGQISSHNFFDKIIFLILAGFKGLYDYFFFAQHAGAKGLITVLPLLTLMLLSVLFVCFFIVYVWRKDRNAGVSSLISVPILLFLCIPYMILCGKFNFRTSQLMIVVVALFASFSVSLVVLYDYVLSRFSQKIVMKSACFVVLIALLLIEASFGRITYQQSIDNAWLYKNKVKLSLKGRALGRWIVANHLRFSQVLIMNRNEMLPQGLYIATRGQYLEDFKRLSFLQFERVLLSNLGYDNTSLSKLLCQHNSADIFRSKNALSGEVNYSILLMSLSRLKNSLSRGVKYIYIESSYPALIRWLNQLPTLVRVRPRSDFNGALFKLVNTHWNKAAKISNVTFLSAAGYNKLVSLNFMKQGEMDKFCRIFLVSKHKPRY